MRRPPVQIYLRAAGGRRGRRVHGRVLIQNSSEVSTAERRRPYSAARALCGEVAAIKLLFFLLSLIRVPRRAAGGLRDAVLPSVCILLVVGRF